MPHFCTISQGKECPICMTQNPDDLRHCPFCGGKAISHQGMAVFQDCEISCMRCDVNGGNFNNYGDEEGAYMQNYEDAMKAWNTRQPTANNEKLRKVAVDRKGFTLEKALDFLRAHNDGIYKITASKHLDELVEWLLVYLQRKALAETDIMGGASADDDRSAGLVTRPSPAISELDVESIISTFQGWLKDDASYHKDLCEKYAENDEPSAKYHAGAVTAIVLILNRLPALKQLIAAMPQRKVSFKECVNAVDKLANEGCAYNQSDHSEIAKAILEVVKAQTEVEYVD